MQGVNTPRPWNIQMRTGLTLSLRALANVRKCSLNTNEKHNRNQVYWLESEERSVACPACGYCRLKFLSTVMGDSWAQSLKQPPPPRKHGWP